MEHNIEVVRTHYFSMSDEEYHRLRTILETYYKDIYSLLPSRDTPTEELLREFGVPRNEFPHAHPHYNWGPEDDPVKVRSGDD